MSVPQSFNTLINSARLLNSETARLNGSVSKIELEDGTIAYLKTSTGFGRRELLQDIKVCIQLQDTSLFPHLLAFEDTGEQVRILLSEVPGQPLHLQVETQTREAILRLLADVLQRLWTLDLSGGDSWENGAEAELANIAELIHDPIFDQGVFEKYADGIAPLQILSEVQRRLKDHRSDVFTHGDLCLPNIITTGSPTDWRLIDLGKAGIGDRYRDLASLQRSLVRNLDEAAYTDLLSLLQIDDDPVKRSTYAMMDWFWYAYG